MKTGRKQTAVCESEEHRAQTVVVAAEAQAPDEHRVRNPDSPGPTDAQTVYAARIKRAEIVHEAGVSELAQGTLVSMEPKNAVESMLCDVPAASYNAGMRLIATASTTGRVDEMVKLTNTASRMMAVFVEGVAVLEKLRRGGRQTVVVRHVQNVAVAPGGKAVIAATGGGGQRKRRNEACGK